METVSVALARTDVDAPVADGGSDAATERDASGTDPDQTESLSDEPEMSESEATPDAGPSDTGSTPGVPSTGNGLDSTDVDGEFIWQTEPSTNGKGGETDG